MEPTTFVLVTVVVGLVAFVAIAARRRRDASLEPIRLGPSWEPPGGGAAVADAGSAEADGRVQVLRERTGVDADTVDLVLAAWDEHLAVLGFLSLPPGHRYRVYDPYDPPIASRGADHRPVAEPARVARDVARIGNVSPADATAVLDALLNEPGEDIDSAQRS